MKTLWSKALALCLFIVLGGISTPLLGQVSAFTGQDVGAPGHLGGFTNNVDGSISINGGGDDIWSNSDNFYYYYASVTGLVWEAKVKIISFEGPDQWSKVNLMARRPNGIGAPPAGGDPHYSAVSTRAAGQNEIRPNWRAARDGGSSDFTPGLNPSYPNQWLRMTRTNTLFTLFTSTDGVNWTQFHSQNVSTFDGTAWEDPILVGVAVTAHNNGDANGATAVVSNLSVTVYTVTPPSAAGILSEITGTANVYAHSEASFNFVATNNANPSILYGMTYEWYKNGVRVATNLMGPNFTFLTVPADNGASIQAVARVNDPAYNSLSVTSAVANLAVNPAVVVYTNGLKREFFTGGPTRVQVEIGSVTQASTITLAAQAQLAGGFGNNYAQRFSGYFIPPATDYYVFLVASDDDCDVYLSTDSDPANKRIVAQEGDWSGNLNWHTPGGGGSSVTQKRSDLWSPDGGVTYPHAGGIALTGGERYYFEAVMRQGGGGDNWAVTYQTTNEVADLNWQLLNFPDGTPSRMTAANQNIALITPAPTTLTWSIQPTNLTVFEGNNATFYSLAQTDSELLPLYTWYVNGVAQATNTNPNVTLPVVGMPLNGAQVSVVAWTAVGGLSITSGPVTLTVQQAVWEPGFVRVERWNGATRAQVNNGTVGTPNYVISVPGFVMGLDNPGGQNDFARRLSGFFVPPTTGDYVFFVNGDDDTDLFISTDATPGNKRLVAQEQFWSGPLSWNTAGNNGSIAQKRSDQWSPDGGATVPYALGIHLNAGQRYYTEVVFHQGGGGANVQATYKLTTEADPVNGANARMVNTAVGMNAVRCSFVAFTEQPAGVAVSPFAFANFSAQGATDSQLSVGSFLGNEQLHTNNFIIYQWQKNGVDIPGATARTLTYGPVLPSDNGVQFTCRIRALGYADNALNRLWSNSVPATLTVTGEAVLETGVARVEWWSNSTRVAILNGAAGNPNRIYTTPKMIAPSDSPMDNYANRVSGFFIAPTTGDYVFFLNSDDDSDLFLSTDATPANKRLIARAIGWSGSTLGWHETGGGGDTLAQRRSDQFTDPNTGTQPYITGIPLTGGQMYYIEGVHNEGSGGDYFAATYKLLTEADPLNGDDSRISGNALAFYAPRIPWVAFTAQPQSPPPVVSGGISVTFSAAGTNAPSMVVGNTGNPVPWFNNPTYLQYQWYKNGTPIPGANTSSYTLSPVLPSDNNAQFVCGIRAIGYADNALNPIYSNSVPAVLTVIPDSQPPTIAYSATFQNTNQVPEHYVVNVTFSEWMNATTLSNAANYSIAGVTITNVSVVGNRTVQLLVNQLPTLPLNLTVSGVQDLSGNTIALNSTAAINAEKLTFSDVGTPTLDPAYPSFVSVTASGGYIITAQGSDIWNTADGFHFAWELKTNDFDVVVRGVSQGHSDTWAKAGLMVREVLDPYSRNWSVVNTPAPDATSSVGNNSIDCNMRDGYAGATTGWKNLAGNTPPTYPNAWVRLKRTGSVLSAYASSNMVNWVQLSAYDTSTNLNGALLAEVYVGLCTASHGNDVFGTAPPFRWYNTAEYADYNSSFVPLPPPATLTITQAGANVSVSWTPAGGHLESSPAVAGPGVNWQPVGGGNPALVPIGAGPQYFRVVNP